MNVASFLITQYVTNPGYKNLPCNIYYHAPRYCEKCGRRIEDFELDYNACARFCHKCRIDRENY